MTARLGRRPLVLGALAALVPERSARAASDRVYVQPLGTALPDADSALVETALRELLGVEVRPLSRVELPASAYYSPRRRYRAERLLTYLNGRLPAGGGRILGLTGVDISTTKGRYPDWGVLGLGELPGTATVISSFRCHRTARGPQHARERLAKVAVHEIGHTLGLDHCPTPGCLMEDAGGTVKTVDRETGLLCDESRRDIEELRGFPLPALAAFDWEAVLD